MNHRFARLALSLALACAAAGCAKHAATSTAPSAAPSAAPSGSPAAAMPAGVTPGASPAATATPQPNLLSMKSGAILRAYPAAQEDPSNAPEDGFRPEDNAAGPWVYVYELPGTAKLTRVGATLPSKDDQGHGATAAFAVSTTGPAAGFADVGTLSSNANSAEQTLPVNATARWVRVTINRNGTGSAISTMAAYGDVITSTSLNTIAGTYVQYNHPYAGGAFESKPDDKDPWYLQVVTAGTNGINGQKCFNGHTGDAFPGTLDGRVWNWQRSNATTGTLVANDDGSMLVGEPDDDVWVRYNGPRPKFCAPQYAGTGPVNVTVLQSNSWSTLYPTGDDQLKDAPRYRFGFVPAGLLDATVLAKSSMAILNGVCEPGEYLNAAQGQLLMNWVQNGHKLLIDDADMCGRPTTYAFLPYQFKSNNPGAQGAKGDRLILVEDDSLGTSDKSDKAHFLDATAYAKENSNQLGDANTVTTQDPHWCGHLFGTNVNHVNGFMQMYALYGKGVIIFDGFDHDDGGLPEYQRVRLLELAQPIPADLPCSQKASLAFVIQPDRQASFTPGKPVTLHFPMEVLANQGWKGTVHLTTSGDFKGSPSPGTFDMNGGTQPVKIAVTIPGNAKPGTYAVLVNADGGNGQSAQATIQLTAAVPLVKQIKQQRRIRIYGIHFDVDKSTIKPQSEPVIAQIAAVMKQNPKWRFRVEGHTDSDGGYAHNMTLSQHRAQAVVNDLVKRYHIARSRLVPVGYGYSHPVAPNTTSAGKALNRRVELYLLNP